MMSKNGSVSPRFGAYKSLCCGAEIIVNEGVVFPDCPNHPKLTTYWKPIDDKPIRHVSELFPPKKNDSAA
jgi:hypothetical protein